MNDLYGPLDEKKKKRKKAGSESSKESSLRDWFGRKGAKGKKKGWVDCNAPDGKGGYKSCGRGSGESRKKYPACRPTPGACKERGKGKSWGKKAKKKSKKKNEELYMDLEQIIQEEIEAAISESHSKEHEEELEKISDELKGAVKMHQSQADRIDKILDETDDEELKEESKNCGCGKDPCETYGSSNGNGVRIKVGDGSVSLLDEKKKKQQKGKKRAAKTKKRDKKKKSSAKKDACYNKVKSRYKVWPSAYASGALVKCRKVGAKNWGNSTKESLDIMIEDELAQLLDEIRCWDGHQRVTGKTPGEKGSCEKIKEVEADLEEKKKKKACKPSKGKRFAKRVNGKCRSYGQKGQAKSGGDRIRPGTKKGDAYCARSAKIKKCKNPPCANALSRKKWKCRGSKSMKEQKHVK